MTVLAVAVVVVQMKVKVLVKLKHQFHLSILQMFQMELFEECIQDVDLEVQL